MKRLILIAALVAASCQPAWAKDHCLELSELAATLMEARQRGMQLSKVVETIGPGLERLAHLAFSEPRYRTPEMQEQAKRDFENMVYLECRKVIM